MVRAREAGDRVWSAVAWHRFVLSPGRNRKLKKRRQAGALQRATVMRRLSRLMRKVLAHGIFT